MQAGAERLPPASAWCCTAKTRSCRRSGPGHREATEAQLQAQAEEPEARSCSLAAESRHDQRTAPVFCCDMSGSDAGYHDHDTWSRPCQAKQPRPVQRRAQASISRRSREGMKVAVSKTRRGKS
eukprot:3622228-Rhodomonas_salina.2